MNGIETNPTHHRLTATSPLTQPPNPATAMLSFLREGVNSGRESKP